MNPVTHRPIYPMECHHSKEKSKEKRLTEGVQACDLNKVKEALKNGADANGRELYATVFHNACEQGDLEIVRELLSPGADVN